MVRRTDEADIAVVLKQSDDGLWQVSARSKGAVDVGRACARLGGGGHRYAAGFTAARPGRGAGDAALRRGASWRRAAARRGGDRAGEAAAGSRGAGSGGSGGRPSGLLVIDKPAGLTSHDVVARVRRLAGTRRVGHAGTLDPMATGVLVVGLEKATRLLGHLTLSDKEYLATIRLGASSDTGDAEGTIVPGAPAAGLTIDAVRAAAAALTGPIQQVPPGRQRDQGGRQAVLPAGPGGRAAGAAAAPGHRLVVHRARRPGRPVTCWMLT